eukprot:2154640-Rhodomonas_salina.2
MSLELMEAMPNQRDGAQTGQAHAGTLLGTNGSMSRSQGVLRPQAKKRSPYEDFFDPSWERK